MSKIKTATGKIDPGELGRTLVHEHIVIGIAGWEADTLHPVIQDKEVVARGVDTANELRARGIDSFIDPLPGNMGRRLDLAAEISARTGINIICATGLFAEKYGGSAYWIGKFELARALGKEDDYVRYLADVFVNEIENGVGPDRICCGIIKVASSTFITDYEMATLKAAALAAIETSTPITTHSDDGILGAEQQQALLSFGVPAHRIIIGHSCNSREHRYHCSVVDNGSYVAFDRYGYQIAQRDEHRIDSMLALINAGGLSQILMSNDGVTCWRDTMQPTYWGEFMGKQVEEGWSSVTLSDKILPELRRRGVADSVIDSIMIDNPKRLFANAASAAEPRPALATQA